MASSVLPLPAELGPAGADFKTPPVRPPAAAQKKHPLEESRAAPIQGQGGDVRHWGGRSFTKWRLTMLARKFFGFLLACALCAGTATAAQMEEETAMTTEDSGIVADKTITGTETISGSSEEDGTSDSNS
jgi:hypothetical protein